MNALLTHKSIPAVGRGGGLAKSSEDWQETSVAASPTTAISNQGTAIVKPEEGKGFGNLSR